MHLLNVLNGGALIYDILSDQPSALPHLDPTDPAHSHGLIVEGAFLGAIYGGTTDIRVPSSHHIAIDPEEIADGFAATAWSPDGVVEAIQNLDGEAWFAVGTQFNPLSPCATELDGCIVREFVDRVKLMGRRTERQAA